MDDDDRESVDFHDDLDELRRAVAAVHLAYDTALTSLPEGEQASLKKNFDLAVVGLRDKLQALEDEAAS